jgi:ferredoxin
MDKMLNKKDLLALIGGLLPGYDLWGPKEEEGKAYSFRRLEDPGQLAFGYRNSVVSPKSVFFPSGETIFRIQKGKALAEDKPAKPTLLALIRPCDARALTLLDKVFGGEIEDPLYVSRRKNALLIGLACNEPDENCFCGSVGGSPFAETGLDILLVDRGESYLLHAVSKRGEEIASACGKSFEAGAADLKKRKETAEKLIRVQFQYSGAVETAPEYWKEKSQACLDCGACAFLCPTCHCFDFSDEGGCRKRIWDTCAFPLFTRMTSGENPREVRRERLRNRVFHKFVYFKETHGEVACVGCGRCLEHCPAGIRITDLAGAEK